jgi:hypothetical protein
MTEFTRAGLKMAASALAGWIAITMPERAFAQAEIKKADSSQPKVLIVSPAAAPVPALKYRLLPSSADLNPGDAAPIYLRAHGYEDRSLDEAWYQVGEKSARWQDLSLKDFPTAEVRTFVNLWSGKLKQIEFGTRRKTCGWNYTLPEERRNAIAILLPDAQSMRQWGRILALKARVEIAEGKYDDAIRTIETGLAFGRHVAEGPFLINGLIGVAITNLMLAPLEDLIAQPGAPNLYWALTALPRPLVSLRDSLEVEQKLLENLIPELSETELNRPRTAAEWSVLVSRMHEGIVKWCRNLNSSRDGTPGIQALAEWDLARFKAEVLPTARDNLKTLRRMTDGQLAEMTDDQIVALYIAEAHRSLQDDHFKAAYLPAREALPQLAAAEARLNTTKPGPLSLFAGIGPTLQPAMMAELRLERRIAALRVVEAVRLFAVAHGGAMPKTLNQITEIPVPDDPSAGKPFEYLCNENSALLTGSTSVLPSSHNTSYRIAIRH